MNAIITQYEASQCSYRVDFGSSKRSAQTFGKQKRPNYRRRRGKGPVQFDGMHRRRRKRISW